MNTEICERWEVAGGIEWPASDVSFAYEAPYVITARIGFANVVRGSNRDLVLRFSGVIALQHESESIGLIPLPENPPRFTTGEWSGYTFPLLRVRGSHWLGEHNARNPAASVSREHFVLITMNDLLHILALPNVEASWTKPVA